MTVWVGEGKKRVFEDLCLEMLLHIALLSQSMYVLTPCVFL